jgi:DNA-binding Lrp family transcriptional regulator
MWRFLPSEMMVILGLSEDADRTDAEIAEKYGMNKGTVASVRRRLLDSGAIYFVNVPSFNKLGCELMAFHMGTTDPGVSSETKANNYLEFCDGAPNVFHGMIGGGHVSFHTVFRDATELESFLQEHNRFFSGARRPSKAKLDTAMFPYELTKGTYISNFAPIVHRFFQLDVPPPKARPLTSDSVTEPDLSENERGTLLELVAGPLLSDRQLASKVRLSRQAVTRIRRKLFEEGYLTRVCIPRLYKWGFEIYAVSHSRFSMDLRWDIRQKSQPKDTAELSFLTLSKADGAVTNHMISKYQEYAETQESMLGWFHKMKVFDESPQITVFSLERCTEMRSFDFLPAVRNLLQSK